MNSEWWNQKPRKINIIVDNPSWILSYMDNFIERIQKNGDKVFLIRDNSEITESDISFFLGCIKIAPLHILAKSKKNLVVHESNLPEGRGFSPLTWQILEGKNEIPICLIEMAEEVDAGSIIFKDLYVAQGLELLDELRLGQAQKTFELCTKYLQSENIPMGVPQEGIPTFYRRRKAEDSEIDPHLSINELFNLFRVVDNQKYPAFFYKNNRKYVIKITKE